MLLLTVGLALVSVMAVGFGVNIAARSILSETQWRVQRAICRTTPKCDDLAYCDGCRAWQELSSGFIRLGLGLGGVSITLGTFLAMTRRRRSEDARQDAAG